MKINQALVRWEFNENSGSIQDDNAFEWGLFAGDGFIDGDYINVAIYGNKRKLESFGTKGFFGKEQNKKGYSDPASKLYLKDILKDLDIAKELNDKDKGIPEYIFHLNKKSLLEFIAGWIETGGAIAKNKESEK